MPLFATADIEAEVRPLSNPKLWVLNVDISATPNKETISSLGDAIKEHVEHSKGKRFLLHVKHVRSPHLENIPVDAILHLAKLLMDNKSTVLRVKRIVLECKHVDGPAQITAKLFSSVVQIPLVMTSDHKEVQDRIDEFSSKY